MPTRHKIILWLLNEGLNGNLHKSCKGFERCLQHVTDKCVKKNFYFTIQKTTSACEERRNYFKSVLLHGIQSLGPLKVLIGNKRVNVACPERTQLSDQPHAGLILFQVHQNDTRGVGCCPGSWGRNTMFLVALFCFKILFQMEGLTFCFRKRWLPTSDNSNKIGKIFEGHKITKLHFFSDFSVSPDGFWGKYCCLNVWVSCGFMCKCNLRGSSPVYMQCVASICSTWNLGVEL